MSLIRTGVLLLSLLPGSYCRAIQPVLQARSSYSKQAAFLAVADGMRPDTEDRRVDGESRSYEGVDRRVADTERRASDRTPDEDSISKRTEQYRMRSETFDYTDEQRQSALYRNEGGSGGGHTLMEHTPRQPNNIREELRDCERPRRFNQISMYNDVRSADYAVQENINANRIAIESEAQSLKKGEVAVFPHSLDRDVGVVYERDTGTFTKSETNLVVIMGDGNGEWSLYTSYPTIPRGSGVPE